MFSKDLFQWVNMQGKGISKGYFQCELIIWVKIDGKIC